MVSRTRGSILVVAYCGGRNHSTNRTMHTYSGVHIDHAACVVVDRGETHLWVVGLLDVVSVVFQHLSERTSETRGEGALKRGCSPWGD